MSYSEENGQVVLRMSREDYEAALKRAVTKLRSLYGTVVMEAPEYVPTVGEGVEIVHAALKGSR